MSDGERGRISIDKRTLGNINETKKDGKHLTFVHHHGDRVLDTG